MCVAYMRIGGEIIPVNNPDDRANTLSGAAPFPLNSQTEGHWEHLYDSRYARIIQRRGYED